MRKIRKYSVFYFLRNQWKSCYEEISYFHGIKSTLVTIVLVIIVNFSRKKKIRILKKCQSKLDCLIFEILLIEIWRPKVNKQRDLPRALANMETWFLKTIYKLITRCNLRKLNISPLNAFRLTCKIEALPIEWRKFLKRVVIINLQNQV